MEIILGCSGNYSVHDLSFAVVDSATGHLLYVGEQERHSRIRHSIGTIPSSSIKMRYFDRAGYSLADINSIAVGCDPDLFELSLTRAAFKKTEATVFNELGLGHLSRIHYSHHLSHAASAYFPSGFSDCAILTVDGQGESQTCGIFRGNKAHIEQLWIKNAPHSLGSLYTRVTQWLGLGYMGDEGKTMGLAPYGTPSLVDLFRENLISWDTGGDFELSHKLVAEGLSLEWLLGPGRNPSEELTQRHKDVAASIQAVLEQVVLGLVNKTRQLCPESKSFTIAGGVALNSVLNGIIERQAAFDRYFFPGWAGDAGLSIGAALLQYASSNGMPERRGRGEYVFAGDSISEGDVQRTIESEGLVHKICSNTVKQAASDIALGKIIGWCQGRAEVGPRALGNRSILANPQIAGINDIVNKRVKFREPWRPFAPSILASDALTYFDYDEEAPFMVTVREFKKKFWDIFPGVVHVDGSARLQLVREEDNPRYHQLLLEVKRLTGHGVVLNTSLNVRGQPIVDTPDDALDVLLGSELDALYLGDIRLDGSQREYHRREPFNLQIRMLRDAGLEGKSICILLHESEVDRNQAGFGWHAYTSAIRNFLKVSRELWIYPIGDSALAALRGSEFKNRMISIRGLSERGIDAVVLLSESAIFGVSAKAELRRIIKQTGLSGYVAVANRTLLPLASVINFSDIWRRAFFEHPPENDADFESFLNNQAG